MTHDRKAAKAKELETRKRLGPRLGHPKVEPRPPTLEPRRPRANGRYRRRDRGRP